MDADTGSDSEEMDANSLHKDSDDAPLSTIVPWSDSRHKAVVRSSCQPACYHFSPTIWTVAATSVITVYACRNLMKANLKQFIARHSVVCSVFTAAQLILDTTLCVVKNSAIFTTAITLSTDNQFTKLLLCYTLFDHCHNLSASLSTRHLFVDVDLCVSVLSCISLHSEWVSSFFTAHQHNIGYAVPYY